MEKIYSVKEASEKTNIPPRSISYYCKRDKVRKKSNKYQITRQILDNWVKDKPTNIGDFATLQETCETLRKNNKDLQKELQQLKEENKKLKQQNNLLKQEISKEKPTNDFLQIISEIDNDDYILIVLNAIKDNKHLEEFSEEEYEQFKDRLKEANFLENRIKEYKEEIVRMEEYVMDYRNNIEYLKKSLDRRAEETAIILKTIEQRNFITAKEKGFDN